MSICIYTYRQKSLLMKTQNLNTVYPEIKRLILEKRRKAYTTSDLQNIFHSNRDEWRLSTRTTYTKFLNYLVEKKELLKTKKLIHIESGSEKLIYTLENANKYDIITTIKKNGYLSYLTALVVHELTLQIPKTLYISEEIHDTYLNDNILNQESIDRVFSKEQRTTTNIYKDEISNERYVLIEKKLNIENIGIITDSSFDYPTSDIERTLIDCVVRPQYSGGIFSVLEAFRNASDILNLEKLDLYLDALNYTYPYHQLVGFYLDRSGYDESKLKPFLNKVSSFNFYMTYNLSNKKLDSKWKIYYPEGI